MPIHKTRGMAKVALASHAKATVTRRKNSAAKAVAANADTTGRGNRGRRGSGPVEDMSSPGRAATLGTIVPGQIQNGSRITTNSRSSQSKGIASKNSDYEYSDNGASYEPSEGLDAVDEYIVAGKPTRKRKKATPKPEKKLTYNKGVRKDTTKFTTSQAMADAEEEFDPRGAAYRGTATQSGGNGRKKGRRLIRWTG
jgi:hypothetical protein